MHLNTIAHLQILFSGVCSIKIYNNAQENEHNSIFSVSTRVINRLLEVQLSFFSLDKAAKGGFMNKLLTAMATKVALLKISHSWPNSAVYWQPTKP